MFQTNYQSGAIRFCLLPPLPDAIKLICRQRKVCHKSLPFPFRYSWQLAHISNRRHSVYSVFHNVLDLVTEVNVMRGGDIGYSVS